MEPRSELIDAIMEATQIESKIKELKERFREVVGVQKYLAGKWLKDTEYETMQEAMKANHEGILEELQGRVETDGKP